MEKAHLIKIVISFFTAGIWIGGATLLAERLGSRKGGLVANLPSTILVSLVFVALVQDPFFAAQATRAVPIGMLIDTIFLLVFVLLLKYGLVKATLLSLSCWLVLALAAAEIRLENLTLGILLYTIVAVASYLLLELGFHIPSQGKNRKKYTPASLLTRVLFAGSVVAGTTILSIFAGTYWVGLFSTFPAVMLSSMIILTLNQGVDFSRATGKIMVISSTNIVLYALVVFFTYPTLGVVLGTVVSFFAAFLWILMLNPILKKLSK